MPNWKEILDTIQSKQREGRESSDLVRRDYLKKLHEYTGRNVIAYYSGFLSKHDVAGVELTHEDTNGFMATIHQVDRKLGLDLILHTPGGGMSAAIAVVNYLRVMFDGNIRAIVPQIAMSAGTMIACSCKQIFLAKHSQLGPTDPQMRGIAAAGVAEEFKRACEEVKADPSRIPIWQAIIGKYPPTFLDQCDNAVSQARDFVQQQLEENMFAEMAPKKRRDKAKAIVKKLTDFRGNRSHDRPITYDEAEAMGLHVERLEQDPMLQDIVLSAHHCYMHAFMNSAAFKIIENHLGTAVVKFQQVQVVQAPSQR